MASTQTGRIFFDLAIKNKASAHGVSVLWTFEADFASSMLN